MKPFFFYLIAFSAVHLFAQTPFEGKVIYSLHTPSEKNDATLTAYFAKQGIRLEFAEKDKPATNDILIALPDSGAVLNLNYRSNTYSRKPLVSRDLSTYAPKAILGHPTVPKALPGLFGSDMSGLISNSVFYEAADLYYPVPEKYKGNTEFLVVSNNRIVLGAEIMFSSRSHDKLTAEDSLEMERNRISAEAVEIAAGHPADSLFTIPAGFVSQQALDAAADSTAMYQDSVNSAAVAQPLPRRKNTSPKNKKSGPQKTPANRRKQR